MNVFVTGNADAIVEEARRASPVSVDVSPVTLRDVFLERVQHAGSETA